MRFLDEIVGMDVYSDGSRVGSVYEAIINTQEPYPKVVGLGIRFEEVQRLDGHLLLEPVEDIVCTVSWEEVRFFSEERLDVRPDWGEGVLFDFESSGLLLLRKNIIDTQIVDCMGHKIQRVDDVVLAEHEKELHVIGLQTGIGGMISRYRLEEYQEGIISRFKIDQTERLIPWTAVKAIDTNREFIMLAVGLRDDE